MDKGMGDMGPVWPPDMCWWPTGGGGSKAGGRD